LASKVTFAIDSNNPYPRRYSGHVRVELADGRIVEERQADLRGGSHDPLSRAELEAKFLANAQHGGWNRERAQMAMDLIGQFFASPVDLVHWRG
jgi:hypothetical protein